MTISPQTPFWETAHIMFSSDLEELVVVAVGMKESPEFQRQAREFAASLVSAGRQSRLLVAERLNHFEVLLALGTPD